MKAKLAVVLIRGTQGVEQGVRDTLKMLHLHAKHSCSVIYDTPDNRGMLRKVKDFVAYGFIDESTFQELVSKRGEEYKGRVEYGKGKVVYNRFFDVDGKKFKKYFRLQPPRGGFERKGVKAGFGDGGALGDRKDKMKDLIRKMV